MFTSKCHQPACKKPELNNRKYSFHARMASGSKMYFSSRARLLIPSHDTRHVKPIISALQSAMGSFIDRINVCGFFQCGKFEFVDICTKRLYTKHMDAKETRAVRGVRSKRWEL